MRKRALCILLALLLIAATVSCRRDPSDDTPDSDTVALPDATTADDGSDTDDDPQPSPAPTLGTIHLDSLAINDTPCFDGDILASLKAAGYALSVPAGPSLTSLTLSGWVGFPLAIDAFGYAVDGGEPVYGLFATHTEQAVKDAGGAYALRFTVTVPLMSLRPGAHSISFLVKLADGSVTHLLEPIVLPLDGPDVDISRPYHSSVTRINGQGPGGSPAYTDRGGSIDKGLDILDATLDGHKADQDRLLRISGWVALEGGVDHYVWSADGLNWFPAVTNGQSGEPSAGYFTELGYENATENAVFADLILDLSPYHDRTVAVTVGAIPKDSPETVVPFVTVTGLKVPYLPADITYAYVSSIENDEIGDDLTVSDLAYQFQFCYGAGNTHYVTERDGSPVYAYDGIHSFQASMNGTFAMTARIREMQGCSFFFVRGTRTVRSVVPVPLSLDNFYETDGLGLCGGAGIYAKLADGTLTVVTKGLDPHADYRIQNHTFYFPAAGSELTMADDGRSVHILVDGEWITSVKLTRETQSPAHFASVSPYIQFAETAEIILADGRTSTVVNTLVASTCNAQCGAAIRGGGLFFDRITVQPYAEAFPEAH